jgi:soluble lytic murein transglycosylase-like protein
MDYLGENLEKYDGDMDAALTAYNAGHDTGKRSYAAKVRAAADYWSKED